MSRFGFGEPPDAYPLTDRAEVEDCRRILADQQIIDAFVLRLLEAYDMATELGAARDLELWGGNPFEED